MLTLLSGDHDSVLNYTTYQSRLKGHVPREIRRFHNCALFPALNRRQWVLSRFIVRAQATIFCVSKERWAQIGITTEFLIVVRTLGEFFRLRHVHGTNFSAAMAALYVGGALIAACSCWAGVTFYFLRRYTLSAWITLATVPVLLVYKISMINW